METHEIHDKNGEKVKVGFHDNAKEAKYFLREDEHLAHDYLKEAEEHGKAHFEDAEGREFTMVHDKSDGSFLVRPRNR